MSGQAGSVNVESLVTRDVALRALRAAGPPESPKALSLSVKEADPSMGWMVTIASDEFSTVEWVPPLVGRRLINRWSKRFMVPKIWFYEPLSIPGAGTIH